MELEIGIGNILKKSIDLQPTLNRLSYFLVQHNWQHWLF